MVILISLSAHLHLHAQSPGDRADFLIVEKPANLLIYNKYEQRITVSEGKNFQPYRPLQILEAETYLSDNFTPCMKIQLQNRIYYLIRDEDGDLENSEKLGYFQIFNKCTVVRDTVEVLVNRTLFIAKRPGFQSTAASQKYFLQAGDKLLRLFRRNDFFYVQKLGITSDYGWSFLAGSKKGQFWGILRPIKAPPEDIPGTLSRQIEIRVTGVNRILEALFNYFNRKTGEKKIPPQWRIKISGEEITCALVGGEYQGNYQESTRHLVNRLESLLLGTPFEVFSHDGEIKIRRK